jgi:uncharacterized protein
MTESVSKQTIQPVPTPTLPEFIRLEADGVYADLGCLPSSAVFHHAVDQLFVQGWFFRDLNYPRFIELAFRLTPGLLDDKKNECIQAGEGLRIRFASGMRKIDEQRVPLYRGLKVAGKKATYFFEPLSLEEEVEVAVTIGGEAGGEGAFAGTEKQVVETQTTLDIDEFVNQMWIKGLRFGLDIDRIRIVIAQNETGRITIAEVEPPLPSKDATVRELHDGLRRNDTPRLLPDGRVDLTQFRNRFPQIKAGTRLLQKVPFEVGLPGFDLKGEQLPPSVPKDIQLADLVGKGTRVEQDENGEYLIAIQDGFLDIDEETNRMSVTEAIVNRQGVSLKTTGDLKLVGEIYEEYGEIQERRQVEGRSLTLHANVYGRLISRGGLIDIRKNISGGSALNHDGPIVIQGLAINSQLQSPQGNISATKAEGCILIGKKVTVQRAINCDILAEEIEVGQASGCALGGQSVKITQAIEYRGMGNQVCMLLPDLRHFDRALAMSVQYRDRLDKQLLELREQLETVRSDEGLRRYLAITEKLKKGELSLTPAQKPALKKLAESVSPKLKRLSDLIGQQREMQQEKEKSQTDSTALEQEKMVALARLCCEVDRILGELIVVQLPFDASTERLFSQPPAEVRAHLRNPVAANRIFVGHQGYFDWHPHRKDEA